MLDWIRTWTFFNWLAIVAFLMAIVGFLNSFLSLKSRYLDWRGVQSRNAFEKRLVQLTTLVNTIGTYRNDPNRYYFVVIDLIATILVLLLEAVFCFFVVFITTNYLRDNWPLTLAFSISFLIALGFAGWHANTLLWLARYVHIPSIVKDRVTEFLSNGVKKGLVPKENDVDIAELLFNHNMLTVGEHENLINLIRSPK